MPTLPGSRGSKVDLLPCAGVVDPERHDRAELAEEADQVDGPEHDEDERDEDGRRVLARPVPLDQQIGVIRDHHRRHGVDRGDLRRRERPRCPLAGANDEAARADGRRDILELDLDRLARVADLDVLSEVSDRVERRLRGGRREPHHERPALRRLGRRRQRAGLGRGRRGLRLERAERPHDLASARGERAAGVVLGDELVAWKPDPHLIAARRRRWRSSRARRGRRCRRWCRPATAAPRGGARPARAPVRRARRSAWPRRAWRNSCGSRRRTTARRRG